jgi:hypothetical protein
VTQTVTAPRAAAPATAPPNAADVHRRDLRAARRRRGSDAIRRYLEGTPGRLRIAAAVSVLSCVVFALLGASAFQARGNALTQANANAAQLIRVQQIATELVKADSLLTNAYLSQGRVTPVQQQEYDTSISGAAHLITQASQADSQDAAALATVNDALSQYTARAADARDHKRLGLQVGTGYLRQAGALLRGPDADNPNLISSAGMLPTLQKLIDANTTRVDDAFSSSRRATWLLIGAGVIALGGLITVQVWVARRSRRYLNYPLAAATGTVLVLLAVGGIVMARAQSGANRVYDSSYTAMRALASARIAAYTAKSDGNVSLLYVGLGGNYGAYEKDFTAKITVVQDRMARGLAAAGQQADTGSVQKWTDARAAVNKESAIDWPTAASDASQADGKLNSTFNALDGTLESGLNAQAAGVDTGLSGSNTLLLIIGWLALVAGFLAAVAAWVGISQRLEEYR